MLTWGILVLTCPLLAEATQNGPRGATKSVDLSNFGVDLGNFDVDFGHFGLDFGNFGVDLNYFGVDLRQFLC